MESVPSEMMFPLAHNKKKKKKIVFTIFVRSGGFIPDEDEGYFSSCTAEHGRARFGACLCSSVHALCLWCCVEGVI